MATFLKQWGTYYIVSGTGTPYSLYDSSGRIKIYLVSQSISGNYSDIEIKHYGLANATDAPYYGGAENISSTYRANEGSYGGTYKTVSYIGQYYVSSTSIEEFYIGKTTHRIYHKTDGTATLYFNGSYTATVWEGYDYNSATGTKTSSSSVALPTIPRATSITTFTWVKASGASGISRLTCNWATAHSIDRIQYSLNSGAWTTITGSGTSGSFNISDLTPNTQYSLKIKVKRADSQVETESSIKYATTYDIGKIIGAGYDYTINMGTDFPVTYTNPSGGTLQLSIHKTDGMTTIAQYRTVTSDYYMFSPTTTETNAMYNTIPTTNSISLRVYLRTSDGLGNTYLHYVTRTFQVVDADPTFTAFTYQDLNSTTTALTGSNQIIIKGYSSLRALITSENKMIANKGAEPKEYLLTVTGSTPVKADYSASSTVNLDIGIISTDVFTVHAIDSRGNSTSKVINASTYKSYFNLTKNASNNYVKRTGDISKETTLKLSGTFWNSSFGSVTNDFDNAKYRYKKTTDTSYSAYTNITLTKSGNDFSYNSTITGDDGANGFLIENSYNIQVLISDKLSSLTLNFILGTGTPSLAIHKDGIAINGIYDVTTGGVLQVNGTTIVNGSLISSSFFKIWNDGDKYLDFRTADNVRKGYIGYIPAVNGIRIDNNTSGKALVVKDNGDLEYDDKEILYGDSGWIIPTLNTGWTTQYSSAPVRYRKIGNVVYLESFVTGTSGAGETIFTLPVGYRPSSQYKRFPVYINGGTAICGLDGDGKVRYAGKGSNSVTWFCINTSFVV